MNTIKKEWQTVLLLTKFYFLIIKNQKFVTKNSLIRKN